MQPRGVSSGGGGGCGSREGRDLVHGVVQVACGLASLQCNAVQERGITTEAQGIEGEEAAGRAVEHRNNGHGGRRFEREVRPAQCHGAGV